MANNAVFGIASSETQAVRIVAGLRNAGFADQDLSVLSPRRMGDTQLAHETHTKAPEGASVGAGTGGVVGGVVGLLAGIGLLAIPGLGPLVAAGPILGTLSGMAAGAGVGGIAGALIGLGIPEVEARLYESRVHEGNILISAHVGDNDELTERARSIFQSEGASEVRTLSARMGDQGTASGAARRPMV